MDHRIELYQIARFAFPFDPASLGPLLPIHVIGVYVLFDGQVPVYVGRSDTCLRRRLLSHNQLGRATHVAWLICRDAEQAYYFESYWYHKLHEGGLCLNLIHPASPAALIAECPFCPEANDALCRVLPHLDHQTGMARVMAATLERTAS